VGCRSECEEEEMLNFEKKKETFAAPSASDNEDENFYALNMAPKVVVPIEVVMASPGSRPKNKNFKITCEAVIAGSRERFIIDTGASSCLVTADLQQRLGLQPIGERQSVGIAGGEVGQGQVVEVDDMLLGGVSFTMDPTVFQLGDNRYSMEVSGILGIDFLQQFACADFDFAAGVLNLYLNTGDELSPFTRNEISRLGLKQAPLFNHPTGVVCTSLGLQGSSSSRSCQFQAVVDMGCTVSIVNQNAADEAELNKGDGFTELAASATGVDYKPLNISRGIFYKLLVGSNFTLKECPVYIADFPIFDVLWPSANSPAGIVGLDILGKKRTVIDFKSSKLYISS